MTSVPAAIDLAARERPAAPYEYERAGLAVQLAILEEILAMRRELAALHPAQTAPQPPPAQAGRRR